MSATNLPRKIIIHHTADQSRGAQLQKINEYHRQRWDFKSALGSYVGYQYLVEKNGEVYQTRLDTEKGAHTIGQNTQSIGIALAGNFDVEEPTANQRLSMTKIIDKVSKIYQIPASAIYPHRHFAATSCYGIRLNDNWARDEYRSYLIASLNHILTIIRAILENISIKTHENK